ncbi:MAG: hypothetical protein J2P17_21200 [Mycobacterium sp.]|nr:hypothetical protein [Mycobacterium sp.]
MTSYPGGDTVGIVTKTATGETDSMDQPVTVDTLVTVYGACFEPGYQWSSLMGAAEQMSDTITTDEDAWVHLPYVPGYGIPAVDGDGNQVAAVITNQTWIRSMAPYPSRDYKVLGQPDLQCDLDGMPNHLYVKCEWRAG